MKVRPRVVMALRVVAVLSVAVLAAVRWPDALLRPLAVPLGALAGAGAPHLRAVEPEFAEGAVKVSGEIVLDLALQHGEPMPPVRGAWRRGSGMLLAMGVVGFSVWAAPPMSGRRRLVALPIVLIGLTLAGGLWLSVDLQVAALGEIGQGWLGTLPLASSEANRNAFAAIERWFRAMETAKAFLDGGGALLLAALAGLIGRGILGAGPGENQPPARKSP